MDKTKTVVEELTEAHARIATLEASATESLTQHESALSTIAARDATIKEHVATIAARDATIAASAVSIKAEQDANEATRAELATAKTALANPAFAAAAATGSKAKDGATPAAVHEDGAPATKAEAIAQYRKIEDPKARAEYRVQHKDILGL